MHCSEKCFPKIFDEYDHKPNEIWLDQNFVKTLKKKICKHGTAVSKNVYINKLDEIVDKYTKTYQKKKSADVKLSIHIEYMILILSLLTKVVNWKLEIV